MKTKHQIKVSEFLKEASQFQLGELATESSHPKTTQLSQLSQSNLSAAIQLFQEIEIEALSNLLKHSVQLEELSQAMLNCLQKQGRVFFCGCGATGRLSISLETNWRESLSDSNSPYSNRIVGFIAGGDYALVKSIENFEDHPEYGARQLLELGFNENDLLVSCTEGGETPFVIGATLEACLHSKYPSYFLFCNSKASLSHLQRCQSIFDHSNIKSWSLESGPQAICGSTRLQASSILYLACGLALFSARARLLAENAISIKVQLENYVDFLKKTDLNSLHNLIEIESQTYQRKQFLTYHLKKDPMPILTDLTERSPTFNLLAIENELENSLEAATTSLCLDSASDSQIAWNQILGREPRALNWPELKNRFDKNIVLGFDFSSSKDRLRELLVTSDKHRRIYIVENENRIEFTSPAENKVLCSLNIPTQILEKNLFLKLIFNLVSTLTQCRNGRVRGNIMLFVKPSNKKLIDRAARFTRILLKEQHQLSSQFEEIIDCVFTASESLQAEESVVLKSVDIFLNRHKSRTELMKLK